MCVYVQSQTDSFYNYTSYVAHTVSPSQTAITTSYVAHTVSPSQTAITTSYVAHTVSPVVKHVM